MLTLRCTLLGDRKSEHKTNHRVYIVHRFECNTIASSKTLIQKTRAENCDPKDAFRPKHFTRNYLGRNLIINYNF